MTRKLTVTDEELEALINGLGWLESEATGPTPFETDLRERLDRIRQGLAEDIHESA